MPDVFGRPGTLNSGKPIGGYSKGRYDNDNEIIICINVIILLLLNSCSTGLLLKRKDRGFNKITSFDNIFNILKC